jgi:hypothetical protein
MSASRFDTAYRIVFAAGALGTGWWLGGAGGVILAAPLAGWLIAPVLYDSGALGYHTTRWLALHHLQGNYYAYKDNPIEVLEGDDGFRWLRVTDLRRTLRDLPKDATLQLIEPERTERDESGKHLAMRSDALLHWLSKAHTDEHIRFKVWVERTVHHPSRAMRREREKKAVQGPVA